MIKLKVALILVTLVALILPGCTNDEKTEETPVSTDFTEMLELVPYSIFENGDISYGNPEQAWQLYVEMTPAPPTEGPYHWAGLSEVANVFPPMETIR